MNRLASGFLAIAFFAGSAGLAFATTAPAANQNSALPAQQQPMPHHAMHMAATHGDATARGGDRMTAALNALEANGYGDFSNFRQDGQNFAATVAQNGQHFTITVNPDTHQVTRQG